MKNILLATAVACLPLSAFAGSFDPAVMDPVVLGPENPSVCYPVLGTLSSNEGEVLYWTGSPAMGNCVTAVNDGDEPYYYQPERPSKPEPQYPEKEFESDLND